MISQFSIIDPNHIVFKIYIAAYHILYKFSGEVIERMKMDRRRLEHAHFRYAMLTVAQWYPGTFNVNKVLFTCDQSETTLTKFTLLYLKAFYEKYSGVYCIFDYECNGLTS